MRPDSLLVEGFTAFRTMSHPVDFTGAELFAFTGATGAGKSSLLDAMCFAMYGRVPRLGLRLVEPIISLGLVEAKVDFHFSVGPDRYRVTRVVRRTKGGGAQIAEARFVHGAVEVSGTDQVTAEVERVTGLGFEHFTKCVVLPQGQFSAFLHDKPADRQELLRSLLSLELYDRIRQKAVERRTAHEAEVSILEAQLADVGDPGEEGEALAVARLEELRQTKAEVTEAAQELDRIHRELVVAEAALRESSAAKVALAEVTVPPDVPGIAERLAAARAALAESEEAVRGVEAKAAELEERVEALPSLAALDAELAMFDRSELLTARIAKGREMVAEAQARLADGQEQLASALEAERAAVAELGKLRERHLAHALRSGLVVGDDCPVCDRPITELTPKPAPAGVARLEGAARKAETEVENRRRAVNTMTKEHAGYEAQLATLEADLADLQGRLPADRKEKLEERGLVATLAEEQRTVREELRRLRQVMAERMAAVEGAGRAEHEAWLALDRTRDRLSSWNPPALARLDLGRDWSDLVAWAAEQQARLGEVESSHSATLSELAARRDELGSGLSSVLAGHGLGADGRSATEIVNEAVTIAEQWLERIRESRHRAGEMRVMLARARSGAELAAVLAKELAATGFEAWILEEALAGLVEGTNAILAGLSGEAYSLEMVRRDFMVVDHRNAGERRSVKTLSGGETFLVSLALALSLAERVASTTGNARLESIFLDEGFGTLDGDTLEIVAGVLHELSAGDRTVGIVTHVKELAEQLPVRFVVEKGPAGATVRREG